MATEIKGYLLDTCILSAYFRRDAKVVARIEGLPQGAFLAVSVITCGEGEYGRRFQAPCGIPATQTQLERIGKYIATVRGVTTHVSSSYGDLRARLFRKFAPKDKKGLPKHKWPEDLRDLATGKELGIQENDLWLAAQAITHRYVLVTSDRMRHIREVVTPEELMIEDWTV
jgi:tRNA(fMet)-specific endonuclease VapC